MRMRRRWNGRASGGLVERRGMTLENAESEQLSCFLKYVDSAKDDGLG